MELGSGRERHAVTSARRGPGDHEPPQAEHDGARGARLAGLCLCPPRKTITGTRFSKKPSLGPTL